MPKSVTMAKDLVLSLMYESQLTRVRLIAKIQRGLLISKLKVINW